MVDKDLLSIQEARSLVRAARAAQAEYSTFDQARVDAICKAICDAGAAKAEELGQMAHEETGYGKPQDKKIKNLLATRGVYAAIKDMKTVGVLGEDRDSKVMEVAVPVGVIAGVVPSTNPTSTVFYKSLIALKAGNAIVFTPHPTAKNCTVKAVETVKEAIKSCGANPDLVGVITTPTMEGSAELMKIADLILATGGPGMVKAAYCSGTPALGVGPGNVPAYIERSADIEDAVTKIFASKTFDNGTICASEQSIVVDACIADQVRKSVAAHGGFFLEGENLAKVKAIMERGNGSMNPAIVGRDAKTIAKIAGIQIPEGTKLLVSDEKGVGPKYPFSKEKLTALIGFYVVEDWNEACELCKALLHNMGKGHTLSIHTHSDQVVREFGHKKPVSRIVVNSPSTHSGVGLTSGLFPAFTLGCGAVGGSATSDNVTPMHLLNVRYVAGYIGNVKLDQLGVDSKPSATEAVPSAVSASVDIEAITKMIVAELKKSM